MRTFQFTLILVVSLMSYDVSAQSWAFTKSDLDYTVELPSPAWRAVQQVDVHDHVNFIYTNNSKNAYLRLAKRLVRRGETAADLFHRDQTWELKVLPGYVFCGECKGTKFEGQLRGSAFAYEYTSGGRAMAGRIYYLQMDKQSFCVLHFTAARERLKELLEQMDSIARSVRLK